MKKRKLLEMDSIKGSQHKKEKKNETYKGAGTLADKKECVREFRRRSWDRYQRKDHLCVG